MQLILVLDSSSRRERLSDKQCYRTLLLCVYLCVCVCVCVCVCLGAAGLTAAWWPYVMEGSQQADQSNEKCMAAADTPGPGSPEMDTHSRSHTATTSPWYNKLKAF